jgi:type I restriction enzyme R subunit
MNKITESNIETFAIEILQKLGWEYVHGLALAPGAECAERESFEQIILTQRLCKAVARLNRDIPADAQEQAVQNVLRIYSPDMLQINEIRTLTPLRDTLLPKLISGEVRVKSGQDGACI